MLKGFFVKPKRYYAYTGGVYNAQSIEAVKKTSSRQPLQSPQKI